MINLAVILQNRGVDKFQAAVRIRNPNMPTAITADTANCNRNPTIHDTEETEPLNDVDIDLIILDEAIVSLQKALSLILRTSALHMLEDNVRTVQRSPPSSCSNVNNEDFRHENGPTTSESLPIMSFNAIQSIKLVKLQIKETPLGPHSSQYVYWDALKIPSFYVDGMNVTTTTNSPSTRSVMSSISTEDLSDNMLQDYKSRQLAMYHSMVVLFNLALCYQYGGKYDVAIDYFMQSYELLTRSNSKLHNSLFFRLCLAIMNNMSVLYGLTNDLKRQHVCQQYQLSTLILLSQQGQTQLLSQRSPTTVLPPSTSSLHTMNSWRSSSQPSSTDVVHECDEDLYEKFLSNVTHLFLVEKSVAPAA